MKTLATNKHLNLVILTLDDGEKLPDKVMIICNDFSVTYDKRDMEQI